MRIGQLESDDMISIVIFGRAGHSSNAVVWNPIGEGGSWVSDDFASVYLKKEIRGHIADAKVHLEFEIEKHIEDEMEHIEHEKERIKKEIKAKIRSEVEVIEENAEEAESGHLKPKVPKISKIRNVIVHTPDVALSSKLFPFNLQGKPTINLQGKPTMTMILTFNRSMLKNKKGSDWEKILEDADIVQY